MLHDALLRVYGRPSGLRCGTSIGAIDAFAHAQGHWHLVTMEASPLLGCEISLRVPRRVPRPGGHDVPPSWPIDFMEGFARNMAGRPLGANHHLPMGAPFTAAEPTKLSAFVLAEDVELAPQARVLQIVGITDDEERLMAEWDA